MPSLSTIRWTKVRAIIFDVDGTLYFQSRLRARMRVDLLCYYALRPWRLRELLILQRFRAEREKRSGTAGPDLENAQYRWCADEGRFPIAKVRTVVNQWMFQHPNQYLLACTYPGTHAFFATIRQLGIKIGIYSDYPANDKLAAMGLTADFVVSSTDPAVDFLKPAPQGLLHLAKEFGLSPDECLFIGDRPELDGICAHRAGMPYLIIDKIDSAKFYRDIEHRLNGTLTST